jgi:hypothetical protein
MGVKFHVANDLYFERYDDGSVRVTKTKQTDDGEKDVVSELLDAEAWASVIASMSYYGEEDYGFYRALNFHQGDPLPSSVVLKDKPPAR